MTFYGRSLWTLVLHHSVAPILRDLLFSLCRLDCPSCHSISPSFQPWKQFSTRPVEKECSNFSNLDNLSLYMFCQFSPNLRIFPMEGELQCKKSFYGKRVKNTVDAAVASLHNVVDLIWTNVIPLMMNIPSLANAYTKSKCHQKISLSEKRHFSGSEFVFYKVTPDYSPITMAIIEYLLHINLFLMTGFLK